MARSGGHGRLTHSGTALSGGHPTHRCNAWGDRQTRVAGMAWHGMNASSMQYEWFDKDRAERSVSVWSVSIAIYSHPHSQPDTIQPKQGGRHAGIQPGREAARQGGRQAGRQPGRQATERSSRRLSSCHEYHYHHHQALNVSSARRIGFLHTGHILGGGSDSAHCEQTTRCAQSSRTQLMSLS